MKPMLKLMLSLAVVFASTFVVLKLAGWLSVEQIRAVFQQAESLPPLVIGLVVATLLLADLFVAMPTLTIMLLAGYFLGPLLGALFSVAGLFLAGGVGYWVSSRCGAGLLRLLVKNETDRLQAMASYRRHGIATILLSRAVPILPEVSACMAGLTGMRPRTFALAWFGSAVPYAIIATYAGSISTLSDPGPAILVAVLLSGSLWLGWFLCSRRWRAAPAP